MKVIDGDSHFMEPLDLFERFIDPPYRDRAMHVAKDPTSGTPRMVVDGKPMRFLDVDELLGAVVAYGQKEADHNLTDISIATWSLTPSGRTWTNVYSFWTGKGSTPKCSFLPSACYGKEP